MKHAVISSTGLYAPPEVITNDELVESYNTFAASQNPPLDPSSSEFIQKASGIRLRHAMDKAGVLDPQRMRPRLAQRPNAEPSLMCEFSLMAARDALSRAGCQAGEVDAVIVSCSSLPRPYPALAIEVQSALGIEGYGYDMNVACSSATFAVQNGVDAVRSGSARGVLVINPEICTAHLNFRDRDSHFIFGDACTAVLIQAPEHCRSCVAFEVVSTHSETRFSNNLRNNFGFLNRCEDTDTDPNNPDKLFSQKGRTLFKEVVPLAASHIKAHLSRAGNPPLRRLWLHQANQAMNDLVAKRVLGREATSEEAPSVLDEYANTASCGSIIAFHLKQSDILPGEYGIICSFGAGYSIGSILVKKL